MITYIISYIIRRIISSFIRNDLDLIERLLIFSSIDVIDIYLINSTNKVDLEINNIDIYIKKTIISRSIFTR